MKEKVDAYVLWPLAKKFQIWIVDQSTARDFTVSSNLTWKMLEICQELKICDKQLNS